LLARHRVALRRFVAGLGLDGTRDGPICHEYGPALQRALLGLDDGRVLPPLLDLGCGEGAGLVRQLRREGVEAFGLDAFAPAGVPFLIRGDWLLAPLGRGCWGTVVSHMAFSHHFLHHHLSGHPLHEAYARRYLAILAALRPGGQFLYTPGLPFFEALLPPERFAVARRPIGGLPPLPADASVARLSGGSMHYVAEIRRLG